MNRERVVLGSVSLALCAFLALQPGTADGSCPPPAASVCPPGTTYDAAADRCQATFSACLPGYVYNALSSQCEVSAPAATSSARCPAGSSFNPYYGKCEAANLSPCPSGYTYNVYSNKCEIPATFTPASSCPDGYTFDSAINKCVGGPDSACSQGGWWGNYEETCVSNVQLPGFNWDDETGLYVGPWSCPPAYSVTFGVCSGPRVTASCPAGSTINAATSKCETGATAACAAGQTYNSATTKCDFAQVVSADASTCPPGYTLNVDTNVCAGVMDSACPQGAGYGNYEEACVSSQQLPGFNWDSETGWYVGPWACPAGCALDAGSGSCSGSACPAGYAFNASTSSCQPSGCPAGTAKSGSLCIAASVCQ